MAPVTIAAIIGACITVATTAASYTAQGITNAKLKANNRNQVFLAIYQTKQYINDNS